MKFFATFVVLLAAPLMVFAQNPNAFNIPASGLNTKAGSTLTLSWTPTTSGTVSLYLRSGASSALIAGVAIATDIPNSGSYTWSVPTTITYGSDYSIEIRSASGSNYTPYFVIDSSNTVASVTNPSSSGTATATVTSSGTSGSSSSNTASSTGSITSSGSSSSASSTGSSSSTVSHSTASAASFQSATSTSASKAAAPRATAAAGMMGLIAMGAMAL